MAVSTEAATKLGTEIYDEGVYHSEGMNEDFIITPELSSAKGVELESKPSPEVELLQSTSRKIADTLVLVQRMRGSCIKIDAKLIKTLEALKRSADSILQPSAEQVRYFQKVMCLLNKAIKKPLDNYFLNDVLKLWLSPTNLKMNSAFPFPDDAIVFVYWHSSSRLESLNKIKGGLIDEALQQLVSTRFPSLSDNEKRHLRVTAYECCMVSGPEDKPVMLYRSTALTNAEAICHQWAKIWCSPYHQLQRLNLLENIGSLYVEQRANLVDQVSLEFDLFYKFPHTHIAVLARAPQSTFVTSELVEILGGYFVKQNGQLKQVTANDLTCLDLSRLSPQERGALIAAQCVNSFTKLAEFEVFFDKHTSLLQLSGVNGAYLTSVVRARLELLTKSNKITFMVNCRGESIVRLLPIMSLQRMMEIIKLNVCVMDLRSEQLNWQTLFRRASFYLNIPESREYMLTSRKEKLAKAFKRVYSSSEDSTNQMLELRKAENRCDKYILDVFGEHYLFNLQQELEPIHRLDQLLNCYHRRVIPLKDNPELMSRASSKFVDKLKEFNISDLKQLPLLLKWLDVDAGATAKSNIAQLVQFKIVNFINQEHIQDIQQLFELLSLLTKYQSKLSETDRIKQQVKHVSDYLIVEVPGANEELATMLKAETNIQSLEYFSLGFKSPELNVIRLECLASVGATPLNDPSYHDVEVLKQISPQFLKTCSQQVKDAALIQAARTVDKSLMQKLVEIGAEVLVVDHDKNTLIHIVLIHCYNSEHEFSKKYEALTYLLELNKIDGSLINSSGRSILFLAVRLRDPNFTKSVLPISSSVINTKTHSGNSPLSMAIQAQSTEKVEWLIQAGADVKDVFKDQHDVCLSALHYAAKVKHLPMVGYFIKDEFQLVEYASSDGNTPILFAAEHSDFDCFKAIGKARATINLRNKHGCNILMQSAKNPDQNVFKSVWEKGNLDLTEITLGTRNVLAVAIAAMQLHAVTLIVNSGFFTPTKPIDGELPVLFFAARYSNKEVFEFLSERFLAGYGINTPFEVGDQNMQVTLLDVACDDVKPFLLEKGAKTHNEVVAEQQQQLAQVTLDHVRLQSLELENKRLKQDIQRLRLAASMALALAGR
ncbi:ankyrin repeat domain-containing protein [Parashewanella tropica]|uniref:ankyrin repeat domain-containing protein n=1 Tax=Parashewanella tropica TaxID=2547970 RepID=UPI0014792D10|nr:ankyrin repeat domain-containing protein [Parashewanella tropica]